MLLSDTSMSLRTVSIIVWFIVGNVVIESGSSLVSSPESVTGLIAGLHPVPSSLSLALAGLPDGE